MSALSCADVREVAPELALGSLAGAERAEALAHIESCARCRAFLGELTDAGDAFTLLVAETEPPAGFEQRVLQALAGRRRRGRVRRTALGAAAAAVAAAAAIVAVVLVRVAERDDVAARAEAGHPAREVQAVPMIGAGGVDAGRAFVSDGDPSVIAVSVAYLIPDGSYGVELTIVGREIEREVGRITVRGRVGAWSGIVTLPKAGVSSITLVDASGRPVCTGEFNAPA